MITYKFALDDNYYVEEVYMGNQELGFWPAFLRPHKNQGWNNSSSWKGGN